MNKSDLAKMIQVWVFDCTGENIPIREAYEVLESVVDSVETLPEDE